MILVSYDESRGDCAVTGTKGTVEELWWVMSHGNELVVGFRGKAENLGSHPSGQN